MQSLKILFQPDMLSRLRSIATQRQVSLACIVRSIIEQYFRTIDSNPKA
jgi:hypothetical protein